MPRSPKKKRNSYTIEKKLDILRDVKRTGNLSEVARTARINSRIIQRWKRDERKLRAEAMGSGAKKRKMVKRSAGRYPMLEKALVSFIRDRRSKGLAVGKKDIQHQALKRCCEFKECVNFKASSGWVHKFLKRNKFSSRRVTGHSQKVPENAAVMCRAFIDECHDLIKAKGIDPSNVINMDETPLYFDMSSDVTYNEVGSKDILLKTTGHDKLRFTAVLSITGAGKKLNPMIIFKNLKTIPKLKAGQKWPDGMHISVVKGGTMTTDLFKEYVDEVIKKRPGAIFSPPSLLVMDHATSHKTSVVVEKVKHMSVLLVPAGCTSLVQPLDVTVNKPLKSGMRTMWSKWLDLPEEQQLFTKKGKRQRASYLSVAQWLADAWAALPEDMIRQSFTSSGLIPMKDWNIHTHTRLKTRLFPDEPIVVEDDDEDDDVLEEAALFSDSEDENYDELERSSDEEGYEEGDESTSCVVATKISASASTQSGTASSTATCSGNGATTCEASSSATCTNGSAATAMCVATAGTGDMSMEAMAVVKLEGRKAKAKSIVKRRRKPVSESETTEDDEDYRWVRMPNR